MTVLLFFILTGSLLANILLFYCFVKAHQERAFYKKRCVRSATVLSHLIDYFQYIEALEIPFTEEGYRSFLAGRKVDYYDWIDAVYRI